MDCLVIELPLEKAERVFILLNGFRSVTGNGGKCGRRDAEMNAENGRMVRRF